MVSTAPKTAGGLSQVQALRLARGSGKKAAEGVDAMVRELVCLACGQELRNLPDESGSYSKFVRGQARFGRNCDHCGVDIPKGTQCEAFTIRWENTIRLAPYVFGTLPPVRLNVQMEEMQAPPVRLNVIVEERQLEPVRVNVVKQAAKPKKE